MQKEADRMQKEADRMQKEADRMQKEADRMNKEGHRMHKVSTATQLSGKKSPLGDAYLSCETFSL